jgi:hypothetical protein
VADLDERDVADLVRAYRSLRLLTERAIDMHSKVQMDTPEDKALHARVVEDLRRGLRLVDSVSPVP